MADGHEIQSSSQTSIEDETTSSDLLKFIRYDQKKNLLSWEGSLDELKVFCHDDLHITEPFTITANGRATVIKNKQLTFNLFTSTKTLQIQGSNAKQIKEQIKTFLKLYEGNQNTVDEVTPNLTNQDDSLYEDFYSRSQFSLEKSKSSPSPLAQADQDYCKLQSINKEILNLRKDIDDLKNSFKFRAQDQPCMNDFTSMQIEIQRLRNEKSLD